jgi:hypothetical protein
MSAAELRALAAEWEANAQHFQQGVTILRGKSRGLCRGAASVFTNCAKSVRALANQMEAHDDNRG